MLIYEYALYHPGRITLMGEQEMHNDEQHIRYIVREEEPNHADAKRDGLDQSQKHGDLLALSTTCKQLRDETMPVFMSVNRFQVYPIAIPLIGKLTQRWNIRKISLEIAIKSPSLRQGGIEESLVEQMVNAKKAYIDSGLNASITVYFAWPWRQDLAPQLWRNGFAVRFDQSDKDAMLEVLKRDICEASDEIISRRGNGNSIRSAYLSGYIKDDHRTIQRLFTMLDNHAEWSWCSARVNASPSLGQQVSAE